MPLAASERSGKQTHCLLAVLTNELRERALSEREPTTQPDTVCPSRKVGPLLDEGVLDALAERIADRVLSKLTVLHLAAIAPAAAFAPRVAEALGVVRE